MTERLQKAYDYLKKAFDESEFLNRSENLEGKRYRFEHSIRVCKAGLRIAEGESFDVEKTEALQIICLLHDIAYTLEFTEKQSWIDHGRTGAGMVRPFLEELGYSGKLLDDMLFGIAIHADGKADFEGEYNAFTRSVQNADDIDRLNSIRVISILRDKGFFEKNHDERLHVVWDLIGFFNWSKENIVYGTETAKEILTEQIEVQTKFCQLLSDQEYITSWE